MDHPAAAARLAATILENESRAAKVARLLHDDVGPTLSAIGFHIAALRADPTVTAEIRGYLEQAIDAVRAASQQLHANPVERSSLPLALEALADRFRATHGLDVTLILDAPRRLPPPLAYTLYRIAELALDNVRLHAGPCRAEIHLTTTPSSACLQVRDDGRGFDPTAIPPSGTGLILIESYTRGDHPLHLRIDSHPGKGTIIEILTI